MASVSSSVASFFFWCILERNCSLQAESCGGIKGIHAKSLHLTSFVVPFMYNVLLEDFVRWCIDLSQILVFYIEFPAWLNPRLSSYPENENARTRNKLQVVNIHISTLFWSHKENYENNFTILRDEVNTFYFINLNIEGANKKKMIKFYHFNKKWLMLKTFLVTCDTMLGHQIWTKVFWHLWLHLCRHMRLHK